MKYFAAVLTKSMIAVSPNRMDKNPYARVTAAGSIKPVFASINTDSSVFVKKKVHRRGFKKYIGRSAPHYV